MPLLLAFFLTLPAHAANEPVHFTTVFFGDEGVVYAGLRQSDGEARVVIIPFGSGERTIIPLPPEAARNDIIGLLTEEGRQRDKSNSKKLFVLSSNESGPMVHVFDRGTSQWKMKGKVKCPSFTKVRLTPRSIGFSCEVGKTRRGKARVQQKTIALGKDPIYRNGVIRCPEFLLRHKGRVAILEGPAPHWDKLRLRDNDEDETERTITASDLLKLPLPPQ